jgi:hypothetical protein
MAGQENKADQIAQRVGQRAVDLARFLMEATISFHKQEFEKFGRKISAQVGRLLSTQATLCSPLKPAKALMSRFFKLRPEAKD